MAAFAGRVTCLLVLAYAGTAEAQSVQGVVTGSVSDSSGGVIRSADLTLTNDGTAVEQHEKSGTDGNYRFSLVPPGGYTLAVKGQGFATKEVQGIVVDASKVTPVNVTLSVATAQTAIEVSEQETMVQTATSDVAITIDQRMIESMPLLSRNVFDLVFAAPAVTKGMNLNPAAGGARESGTTYLLNGADNNDNFSEGSYNIIPPLESVRQFTVLTNNMSAQYGHAAGALVSTVQKAGTNEFHGAGFEFSQNRSFNASDFFSNRQGSPKSKLVSNQYGGEIDGPIVKDKTFFAFAFDRLDQRTGGDMEVGVPTSTELNAMSTNAGPLAQYYLKAHPLRTSDTPCTAEAINAPAAIGHIGCVQVFDPNLTGQNSYYGRIDENFNTKDRLSFTANVTRYINTDKFGGGSAATVQNIPSTDNEHYHHLALVETHIFSANLLNEFTLAHNRHYSDAYEGNGKFKDPSIYIDGADYGLGISVGPNSGAVIASFVQDRWQVQDNLGWTKGKHAFKFGGGWQYGILYRNWDIGGPGFYEFANTTGVTPASVGALNPNGTIGNVNYTDSNFQNDFPFYQELAIDPATGAKANAYRHYIMKDSNLFASDDWKFSKRLTFNLGLRWERYGAPTEVHNLVSQFVTFPGFDPTSIAGARVGPVKSMWKTRNKDFAPRVGFAWDMFGNASTSLRGGYGISYDRIFDNVWSNGAWNPPFYALVDHDATAGDLVNYTVPASVGASYVPGSLPGAAGRVSLRTMDVAMKDSSIQSFYMGVERQLFRDILLRVSYQGSLGRHLPVVENLNRYDGEAYNSTLAAIPPNPLYNGFNYRSNSVTSNYNSMVTELQKRFSRGLQLQFSFTWSRLMDYNSDLFAGETTTGAFSQPYFYVSNSQQSLEYGPGAFDHQKNFKFIFTYELPFFKKQRGFLGHALGGWQLSGFYQGYSGHPLEVYNGRPRFAGNSLDANGVPENLGGDYNLDGVYNDHPNFTGSSVSAAYSHNNPADGIFTDNNPIGCGSPGGKSTNVADCNAAYGVITPNILFINPAGTGARFGTLGRNLFRGPWYNRVDGALMKNFKVTEQIKAQFRFDALNLMNHPNFDQIDTNLNDSGFGKAQFDAGPRSLQLGVRIVF
jgi:hypothetical protein